MADRRLSRWVFGSTPDRVVDRAELSGVPVLVYASASGVPQRIEDYLFPIYRYLSGLRSGDRRSPSGATSETE